MSDAKQTLLVDKPAPGHWRVTLDNPPINVIGIGQPGDFELNLGRHVGSL